MKRSITLCLFVLSLSLSAFAQNAEMLGSFLMESPDSITPLEKANVLLFTGSQIRYYAITDEEGYYEISDIRPGRYLMKVLYQGDTVYKESINLAAGESLVRWKEKVNPGSFQMGMVDVVLRKANSEGKSDVEVDEIIKIDPQIITIGKIKPNVKSNGDRLEVGVGRAGGTGYFLDDPVGMIGQAPTNFLGLSGVKIIDRGVEARYGNFTGGGVQYTTQEIGVRPVNMYQFQSSSPFNGYHHNLGVMYLSRALKHEEYERGGQNMQRTVLGYSFMGSYRFEADPSPSKIRPQVVTDEALAELSDQPLQSSEVVGGYVPSASFLEQSDLKERQARPNAQRHDASGRLKISYNPTSRLNIDLINSFNYVDRRLSVPNYVLMNSDENPRQKYSYINSKIHMKHNLKSPYDIHGNKVGSDSALISRLSYTLDLNYQQTNSEVFNPRHEDRFFDYGYVGKFKTIQTPQYEYTEDGEVKFIDENGEERILSSYYEFTGYRDSLVSFEPGDKNPTLSEYTNFFYQKLGEDRSLQNLVQQGGVLNGQNLPVLYSLYSNPGSVYGDYSKSFMKRLSATAYTEFSLHPSGTNRRLRHDFEVGLSFQQDISGYYRLNASRLWQLMPLLANSHIQNVDKSNPIIHTDEYGHFIDTVSYPVYVDYASQKTFDRNLRQKLIEMGYRDDEGNLITQESHIDVNALSPDVFDLSMFSADELLNNGNSYVSYSGYNHLGERVNGKKGIGQFLSDKENRPVDAFAPVRASAWIQDKFVWNRLIARVGMRFERYDANQKVLKDPFVIYPVKHAGEVAEINGINVTHPSGIGDDYVVYVDNVNNPNKIVGYRDGYNWYDAEGNALSDPSLLANKSSSGRIQPYLVDPQNQYLSEHSFKSFEAQNLFLPRISVSFPINSKSLFFVSYDKLAQNPTVGQTYLPYTTYYYMQSNISGVLPNPELKARVKTEYNIGFTQVVGKYSELSLWASYANVVNDVNQFRIEQAYPYSYTTFSNIDFSTIKRYVAEYEFGSPRINATATYALQFADGTGSSANSAATLIQSGQPNLRSLFPLAYDNRHTLKGSFVYNFGRVSKRRDMLDYSGPYIAGKPILQDAYITATFQAISGQPYTAIQRAVSEAQSDNGVVQRSQNKGNPFGSRMPWTNNLDIRVQKNFRLQDKMLGVYVTANNVLNNVLVNRVYQYTGLAGDDGYLNSPHGQQQVQSQIDAETFMMLYRIRMQNPGNYGSPRMLHLGAQLNF